MVYADIDPEKLATDMSSIKKYYGDAMGSSTALASTYNSFLDAKKDLDNTKDLSQTIGIVILLNMTLTISGFFGFQNSGKSYFVNKLLKTEVLPSCTYFFTCLYLLITANNIDNVTHPGTLFPVCISYSERLAVIIKRCSPEELTERICIYGEETKGYTQKPQGVQDER